MEFWGYRRPDGKVGVRNKILILPASICATDTARIVASQVEGAVTFHNQNGCSQVPSDMKLTLDTIAGMAANPNVYGTVVISLGCEGCQMELLVHDKASAYCHIQPICRVPFVLYISRSRKYGGFPVFDPPGRFQMIVLIFEPGA